MREITLEELLEAGSHFGHQVTRHNPKARDFIFEARDNIHIIDLAKTKEGLEAAGAFVRSKAKDGLLLVVGTKRQAQPIVEAEIKKAIEAGATGIFFAKNRWMGGTLTNSAEVKKNYQKLENFRKMLKNDEEKAKYTKKEIGQMQKELVKLENYYEGLLGMDQKPTLLFIIDTHTEALAVKEANRMGVPTVGIVDTNANPLEIDYPIPANDDAVGSVELITRYILEAWTEGQKNVEVEKKEEPKKSTKSEIKPVDLSPEVKKDTDEAAKKASKGKRGRKPKVPTDLVE